MSHPSTANNQLSATKNKVPNLYGVKRSNRPVLEILGDPDYKKYQHPGNFNENLPFVSPQNHKPNQKQQPRNMVRNPQLNQQNDMTHYKNKTLEQLDKKKKD